ncbi:aspartate aminotransferase family protein [Pantoea sp. At-9b]|uniref:aspartate aminotransferase family protein n=1 Tax=Pantoea sp. (strain At-9b) TaxID=592316 RepID=UPI0001B409FD|nr:aminotransferase class III-fold pyridoxal phosphate-dependent enzyme [Pantoea sp. At-9b]ADU72493.1 aminotransferase class-III [Pantoea sp. At-9b]
MSQEIFPPEAAALYQRDAQSVAGIEKLRFFPLAITAGQGCWLTEAGGRKLLDLSATWTASGLGHGHPAITAAITQAAQAPAGAGGLSAVHPDSVGLAEELLAITPGSGDRCVYLGHAGSDANDVALRACRLASGKRKVVAFAHGYHGGIGLAMRVSGVHISAGNAADPDLYLATYPNPFRSDDAGAAAVNASLHEVKEQLDQGDVACVIVEPILSDGGMVVPPKGFLSGLHGLCINAGVPLICDEVKMGLGRPGLMHAFQHENITPEIVTFGKVLGGGLPLSATVGPKEILGGPAAHALLTTAGNPICTAVGRSVLRVLQSEELPQRAAQAGRYFMQLLRDLAQEIPEIGDIRGHGLAIGVELVAPDGSNKPDRALAQKVVYQAWKEGLVVYYVGGNVLEITPPLVISQDEMEYAVEKLSLAIRKAPQVTREEIQAYAGW